MRVRLREVRLVRLGRSEIALRAVICTQSGRDIVVADDSDIATLLQLWKINDITA